MSISRRELLHLAVVSAAAGGASSASLGCGSGVQPASFGVVSAGNVSSLSVGEVAPVAGQPVFIARDAGGVYAMSTTCTHQGCPMSDGVMIFNGKTTIECRCHGSLFDANGNVTQGPANSPLAHFQVTIDASGAITIDGGKEVGASVRVSA